MKISKTQIKILELIESWNRDRSIAPTMGDIGGSVYLSRNGAWDNLKRLRAQNIVDWEPRKHRAVRIVNKSWRNLIDN